MNCCAMSNLNECGMSFKEQNETLKIVSNLKKIETNRKMELYNNEIKSIKGIKNHRAC